MKKFLGILCLSVPLFANAQNALPATGNVGVGTNNPQSLFHVANGDVLLQSTTSGYPVLWSKSFDGTKSLRLDYNSIIIAGENGVINTTGKDLLLNGLGGANVGIGFTVAPPEKLSVNGNVMVSGNSSFLKINDRLTIQSSNTPNNAWTRSVFSNNIRWNESTNAWRVDGGPYDDFSMMRFENTGVVSFYTRYFSGGTGSYDITDANLESYKRMFIDNTGNVGIGLTTNDTKGYRLAVNGDAIFTKIKVKTFGTWPDYVFKKEYNLLPLSDLEAFIQQHNHLPGVLAAALVEEEGLDLGENQATLLKKIEELTLYVIQQNKQLQEMKAEISSLKNKANNTSASKP
jgi:hypothetical protein